MAELLRLIASDGVKLEAERAVAAHEYARMVLCHPHPLHGGTMRSLVISELFGALPALGISCVRFNFRGVGESGGSHDDGDAERLDVLAAIEAFDDESSPLVILGWSFGADVTLSIDQSNVAGWIAIAPPLRYGTDFTTVGADPRPKLVILAAHDEFRPATEVAAITETWTGTTTETVAGASHFFVGRTDRLIDLAATWMRDELLRHRH